MKITMQQLTRSIAFLFSLVIILLLCGQIFMPKNNRATDGMENIQANAILAEPDNTIDVLMIGDSLAYSAFSPMELWEKYGFTSYVSALPGQPLYRTKDMFYQALTHQSPKIVILEANVLYRKQSLFKMIMHETANLFPILSYHNRWKSLQKQDFTQFIPAYTYSDDLKGFKLNTTIHATSNHPYMKPSQKQETIPTLSQYWVKDILQTCREQNITFLLVSSPSLKNWNQTRHDQVNQFAEENGIPYLDLNLLTDTLGIDWQNDTRDEGDHLNYHGALKTTAYLGQYLKAHYALPDHRSDPAYQSWQESLTRYRTLAK